MSDTDPIWTKILQVNKLLQEGEPDNVSVDSYSGYTGYKPQFVVDAMNEVFGIHSWGFTELSSETTGPSDQPNLVFAKVEAWIQNQEIKRVAWGQSRITKGDLGDARKGAQTDGLKKALSYFSVGTRAYQGLLPGAEKNSKPTVSAAYKNMLTQVQSIKTHTDAEALVESIKVAAGLTGQEKYQLYQEIGKKKSQLSTVKI